MYHKVDVVYAGDATEDQKSGKDAFVYSATRNLNGGRGIGAFPEGVESITISKADVDLTRQENQEENKTAGGQPDTQSETPNQ